MLYNEQNQRQIEAIKETVEKWKGKYSTGEDALSVNIKDSTITNPKLRANS
jgi:hypothetical protein